MTVILDLPPDVEAGLLAQAQAEGLAVSEYVQNLVRGQIAARSSLSAEPRPAYELPPEEWVRKFEAWAESHAGNTVVLPDEAMERESIYADRGARLAVAHLGLFKRRTESAISAT
jgi:hypothetical protein